jgi:geranylgeranyl pyrophosphate synthase
VIRDTGALDELEAHISALTDEAIAALDKADLTEESKNELVALANYVSWRVV